MAAPLNLIVKACGSTANPSWLSITLTYCMYGSNKELAESLCMAGRHIDLDAMVVQDLEMQQAEQKAKWSSAVDGVDTRAMQLQQELAMSNQQLRVEEEKLQQLTEATAALQQRAALVSNPPEAASMQARYKDVRLDTRQEVVSCMKWQTAVCQTLHTETARSQSYKPVIQSMP